MHACYRISLDALSLPQEVEMTDIHFPNESAEYRDARDELLNAEIELRRHIEQVSALRRTLPNGGILKEDYLFEEITETNAIRQIKFSQLFEENKNSLVIYSFMYGSDMELPCPSCTSILDGLNGSAPHIRDRVNFVVIAKSPIQRIMQWAQTRGWNNLRLLSSAQNSYNKDYFAETENGDQLPITNVFVKSKDNIFHAYSTELLYANSEENQEPRHVDMLWPVWNVFDLTPEGRGENWHPQLKY